MTAKVPFDLVGADAPAEADIYKCVHCGLCLQACPTYLELGLETESPRGRVALMKAVHGGRFGLTDSVVGHMELCLQCRACETACPSGVPFGRMMEATRAQITATTRRSLRARAVRFLVFRVLFRRLGLLRAGAWLLKIYQRSGVQWLVRELRVLKPIKSLDQLEQQLPRLPKFYRPPPSELVPAQGQATRRVAMLSGCVMPLVYGPVNEATARVLARNGCDVLTPRAQGCCGSLHAHSGERDGAKALARRNIDVFLETSPDAIIVNAAGCGATMKEYAELLEGDPAYRDKARRFSALVRDVTEFLAELPFEPPKEELPARVTYQDSCHLVHAQGIKDAPRQILRSIPGLRFVEMKASDTCCGAAGVYNVVHRELANGILDQKMANVAAAQPEIIATANPGCMLQLEMGVRRMGLDARVAHVVELLDEAYG